MSTVSSGSRGTTASELVRFVLHRSHALSEGYCANRASAVEAIAVLAQAAGRPIGSSLQALKWTIDEAPSGWVSNDGQASRAELAAYATLTLFAVHHRSRKDTSPHTDAVKFGQAVRQAVDPATNGTGVERRFEQLGAATSWEQLLGRLRSLIQLLKQDRRAFDYGQLAKDLFDWQFPERRNTVRLRWGRDFYNLPSSASLKTSVS
ncbi:type I-E CRISPR-associated protein Cse2/CasB [Pseudoglutamicibacter albus]|uniref:CRISPR system Cascade subunit CasB n=1 Tax=Pseudoglutamicibacter albus TaxID=98671 RepID=A0ABU1Z1Y3_9MICC|nr:type I-E CRISPR-associated protein Cse2/CasB [Pseudoglutamicibacter albus]MDR7294458.1 CRISPR system Cascade subunit CasB [Pseudoglutamicibacter albus]